MFSIEEMQKLVYEVTQRYYGSSTNNEEIMDKIKLDIRNEIYRKFHNYYQRFYINDDTIRTSKYYAEGHQGILCLLPILVTLHNDFWYDVCIDGEHVGMVSFTWYYKPFNIGYTIETIPALNSSEDEIKKYFSASSVDFEL